MNLDGFEPLQVGFGASSYSVNGVYIIINNLPFYMRTLIENVILAGPKEPKGYAIDQMLEPSVDDLITLPSGVELPVFNFGTGQIEMRLVYANLSALLLGWIARIECTGHVRAGAEHHHCLFCKMRQCYLSVARGYEGDGIELRDPFEHLRLNTGGFVPLWTNVRRSTYLRFPVSR
ncbi:hypothetical protein FRC10_004321 [Ceratobasidium sp. 414]|nr:hypothetical protein FRC10_004321 [Ceratobasidium sp. 414]